MNQCNDISQSVEYRHRLVNAVSEKCHVATRISVHDSAMKCLFIFVPRVILILLGFGFSKPLTPRLSVEHLV